MYIMCDPLAVFTDGANHTGTDNVKENILKRSRGLIDFN